MKGALGTSGIYGGFKWSIGGHYLGLKVDHLQKLQ